MQTKQEIIGGIKDELKECGWYDLLWQFVCSRSMEQIVDKLLEIKNTGSRITPKLSDTMFQFFQCKPTDVKVVLLTSLKSNEYGHSILPFLQDITPMKKIRDSLEGTAPTKWGKQGVLQVSTAMTSSVGMEHHYDIWKEWTSYLVNKINEIHPEDIWVTFGKEAEIYLDQIQSPHKRTVQIWPEVRCKDSWKWINETCRNKDINRYSGKEQLKK